MLDLTAANVNAVGKGVYADYNAARDLDNLANIAHSWRAVHSINFGAHIPKTNAGTVASISDTTALAGPSNNEVWQIQAISVVNATLGAINFELKCSSDISDDTVTVVVEPTQSIGAGTTVKIDLPPNFTIDSNVKLYALTSGAVSVQMLYAKVVL